MNILYCGDENIIDGLIISLLSIVNNTKEIVNVYVLTMDYKNSEKEYKSIKNKTIIKLDNMLKKYNKKNSIRMFNVTKQVMNMPPTANINTKFTPYCMLRLYSDLIDELPSKIMYLDTDVVALKDPIEFYNIDNTNYEIVGTLDYYGRKFYKKEITKEDYINSGVLLLNLELIRKTYLFEKCRNECKNKKMLLPDQSALNKYSTKKLIVGRIYNEQKKETENTVFRHFATTFKFFPTFHTQTIKPWDIEKLHKVLKVHSFDNILNLYIKERRKIK